MLQCTYTHFHGNYTVNSDNTKRQCHLKLSMHCSWCFSKLVIQKALRSITFYLNFSCNVFNRALSAWFKLGQRNRVTLWLSTHRWRSCGTFDRRAWWHRTSPAGSGPGANCPSILAACSNMPVETCEARLTTSGTPEGIRCQNFTVASQMEQLSH